MRWTPDLEGIKRSAFGRYVKRYMTPVAETVRFLTLLPMGYGAWIHHVGYIVLGLVVLLFAWCYGLIWELRSRRST